MATVRIFPLVVAICDSVVQEDEVGEAVGQPLIVRLGEQGNKVPARAAELLAWTGVALPELTLFGCRVLPVIELYEDVHRAREASGDGPQRDRQTLETWEWPQAAGRAPAAPLRLVGMLVRASMWRRGLATASAWRGFGPAAVITTTSEPVTELCRMEFELRGVGLVATTATAQPMLVIAAATGRQPPARRRVLDRWVEETLYEHTLNTISPLGRNSIIR